MHVSKWLLFCTAGVVSAILFAAMYPSILYRGKAETRGLIYVVCISSLPLISACFVASRKKK